jgi:endonuclease-3
MATPSRKTLLAKLHRTLKKYYKPASPPEYDVLQTAIYACCLENASSEQAHAAMAAIKQMYYDLNEVRVSTVNELAETLAMLPHPRSAAAKIRRILQSVFEKNYSFDLESLRKETRGKAEQALQAIAGMESFQIDYVVQSALGGHVIPIDQGTLDVLRIVGIATDDEVAAKKVAGLDRSVTKTKGVEFASLLHQLGAELVAGPYSPTLHKVLLEINPQCKERLPKKQARSESDGAERSRPAEPAPSAGDKAAKRAARREKAQRPEPVAAPKGSSKGLARRKPR